VGTYIMFLFPYSCFKIKEKSNSYPNSAKTKKTHQIGFGSSGYP
jgi:hypothetical protein